MFGTLIPLLADRYHLVAPDYPGFGNSDAPSPQQFAYTFETVADIVGTRRCMCWTPALDESAGDVTKLMRGFLARLPRAATKAPGSPS